MKTSAEDKLSTLIRLARLLVPISYEDAESLFNEAIEVAGEVNVDAIHEIALFAPFADHAVGTMSVAERRAVARDLAIVVGDAGVRLRGAGALSVVRGRAGAHDPRCVLCAGCCSPLGGLEHR